MPADARKVEPKPTPEPSEPKPLKDLLADCEKDIAQLQQALRDGEQRLQRLIGRHATLSEIVQREKAPNS